MTSYITITGVELREASGEGFTTVVKSGVLTIKGSPPQIEVDGNLVDVVKSSREPFKRIGRDFKFATNDVMGYYYISLPAGLKDEVYDKFEELVDAMVAGKPLATAAAAKPAAAATAAATATTAAGSAAGAAKSAVAAAEEAMSGAAAGAAKAGAGFFDALKELGQKAAHDTQSMVAAIKAKAEHDMASMQQGGDKPAGQGA